MISKYIWQSNKRAKKTYTEITVGGWEFLIQGFLSRANMSDLAWAVKNGDMDQVKDLVEGKVATFSLFFWRCKVTTFSLFFGCAR